MFVVLVVLVTLVHSSPAPQGVDPNLLQSIFGGGAGSYSGGQGREQDQDTVNVLQELAEGEEEGKDLPEYQHCSDYTQRFG